MTTTATPKFTDAQASKLLEQLQCYAAAQCFNQTRLAGMLGISASQFSDLLKGNYSGDRDSQLTKIEQFLDRESERAEKPSLVKFVETSVSKNIFTVLRQNHVHGTMGAVIADSGVGKTRSFREYALRTENVIYMSASEWVRTHSDLASRLCEILVVGRKPRRFRDQCEVITEKLLGASRLVIVDQAHQLNERAHQFLQNLWDTCNPTDNDRRLGIVLGCTWRFWTDIHANNGHYWFEQLTSRMDAGTNKKIGKAPFRLGDIEKLFSPDNVRFQLTDSAIQHLLEVANGPGGLRTAVANVDHLQHLLVLQKASVAMKLTVDLLKQTQALMLREGTKKREAA